MNTSVIDRFEAIDSPTTFAAFKAESAISFIRGYDPKAVEIAGYRHSVIRYRDTKGNASKPAKMVTIPAVSFPEEYSLLPSAAITVFRGVIEDQQDALIRESIESGASLIPWNSVSLDSCLAALTAVRTGNYLTKESISAWVQASMLDLLTTIGNDKALAKGMDAEQTAIQVAKTINAYKDNFSKLAAKVPNIGMDIATLLQNCLIRSNLADDMSRKLATKLHSILNPASASDDL